MSERMSDEELFSDKLPVRVRRDILSLGMEESFSVPAEELGILRLKVEGSSDIKALGELTKRILEFVHIYSIGSIPTTLLTLNRKFGRSANKFGVSTREITDVLLNEKRLILFESGKAKAFYSASVWEEQKAMAERNGTNVGVVRDNVIANAQ